jgi:SAM-dependent methyltransferase
MLSITTTWQQYFQNHHEGLGTTYERFILHRYFERLKGTYQIQNVLEAPSFGMTGISGINSMWWALGGTQTSIVDHSMDRINSSRNVWQKLSVNAKFFYNQNGYTSLPFGNDSFDMSWNFASLWFVPNLEEFLKELARVSKKVIFICHPNTLNVFHLLN